MTGEWRGLDVEVRDGGIVIVLPGTNYRVTYYKPPNSRQLLAKKFTNEDDTRVSMTSAEFLAIAWRLANHKARELGWIV